MVIYMIFDGFVQKYVLLEKLACDAYMPNAAKIHNAMRCWRLLHLHTWSMPRDVDIPCTYTHGPRRAMLTQRFKQHRLARSFSGNWAPISTTRGRKSGLDFRQNPPPEIGAQFKPRVGGIEPATFRLQAGVPPTRPNSGGQHGHTSSFAT